MLTSTCATRFFFNDTATTEIYTLSLHDALPISSRPALSITMRDSLRSAPLRLAPRKLTPLRSVLLRRAWDRLAPERSQFTRSEEHTSELQSHLNLVCRLLLEKKKRTEDYKAQNY